MDDDTHDSFTRAVARILGERVGAATHLNRDLVARLIEDYAEDCTTENDAVNKILAAVDPPGVLLVMDTLEER